jgi:hypothetical protein
LNGVNSEFLLIHGFSASLSKDKLYDVVELEITWRKRSEEDPYAQGSVGVMVAVVVAVVGDGVRGGTRYQA